MLDFRADLASAFRERDTSQIDLKEHARRTSLYELFVVNSDMKYPLLATPIILAAVFYGCSQSKDSSPVSRNRIDLTSFAVDGIELGSDTADLPTVKGVELSSDGKIFDSIFITLDDYDGEILQSGVKLSLSTATSPADIESLFGQPYWRDEEDSEVILFYEYEKGAVELQFEFPDSTTLGYITLARPGILSTADQRSAYGVDKPWPPEFDAN